MKNIRPSHCAAMALWLLAANISWAAENYAERLMSELRTRAFSEMSDDIGRHVMVGHEALRSGDGAAAEKTFGRLAEEYAGKVKPDAHTYFLAVQAVAAESINHQPAAMDILLRIRESRPDSERVRFLADLERARLAAQCGGSPAIPDFNPTIEEKERLHQVLFETYSPYSPYCREIIEAHIELAGRAYAVGMSEPRHVSYMNVALQHYREAQSIVDQIKADPSLAADKTTIANLERCSEYLPVWIAKTEKACASLGLEPLPPQTPKQRPTDRPPAKPDQPAAESDPSALIRSELLATFEPGSKGPLFGEESAELFAKKYGLAAAPVMIAMLGEDISPRLKGEIAFYLGKIEDTSTTHCAVGPIIALIESARRKPIGEDEIFMLTFSTLGLGFTKCEGAVSFLERMVDADFWQECILVPYGPTAGQMGTSEGVLQTLREGAIVGIIVSGNRTSLQVLNRVGRGTGADLLPRGSTAEDNTWIAQCKDRITGKYLEERKRVSP